VLLPLLFSRPAQRFKTFILGDSIEVINIPRPLPINKTKSASSDVRKKKKLFFLILKSLKKQEQRPNQRGSK
jgi:hypothetical protein